MLTLHHLNDSRSQRILWLLEELGTPYEMKRYQRDATTRLAPPELAAVHPLGKSPVITDGDIKIAESGAIVDYIIRKYGKGAMSAASAKAKMATLMPMPSARMKIAVIAKPGLWRNWRMAKRRSCATVSHRKAITLWLRSRRTVELPN